MLVKFISACGGISYHDIPESNMYNDYYIPIAIEPKKIGFAYSLEELSIGYKTRTFRYDTNQYDELHHKRMTIYREYVKE